MITIRKGVSEEIREGFDWSERLIDGDTISASSWTVDVGITGGNAIFSDTATDIDISGGTRNQTYRLTNLVTGSPSGMDYERSIKVLVVER